MSCLARGPGRTKEMRRARIVKAVLIVAAVLAATTAVAYFQASKDTVDQETAWVCPMHADYTMDVAGKCPRCGMDLVRAAPFDVRDYQLEMQTSPSVVRAGQKVTLRFKILHPGSGDAIRKFEVVHEKQYHLFVISQDMEFFEHIHPEEQSDGSWVIETMLPKPGYYKVLSDFMPSGGAPQFIARPLVTAGYAGDLESDSAHLVPDKVLTKTVDDITAKLDYDPAKCIVGLYCHLNFHLFDAKTGLILGRSGTR